MVDKIKSLAELPYLVSLMKVNAGGGDKWQAVCMCYGDFAEDKDPFQAADKIIAMREKRKERDREVAVNRDREAERHEAYIKEQARKLGILKSR